MSIVYIKISVRVRGNMPCLGGIKLQSQDKHGLRQSGNLWGPAANLLYLFEGKMVCNTV